MRKEVIFQPKSSWQKEDCFRRCAEYDCPNKSTLEAVCGSGSVMTHIRCCEDEECKAGAAVLAESLYEQLQQLKSS